MTKLKYVVIFIITRQVYMTLRGYAVLISSPVMLSILAHRTWILPHPILASPVHERDTDLPANLVIQAAKVAQLLKLHFYLFRHDGQYWAIPDNEDTPLLVEEG